VARSIFRHRGKFKIPGFYDRHLFDIAFPLEIRHKKRPSRKGWITQGIKMSNKNMRFLSRLKKQPNLTENIKMYITKCKIIYKRVFGEAKRRENDKNILHATLKSKAVWQVINKEIG
jgi:hypothetical protein